MKSRREFPQARPERNSGKKLTQIIQTRTPIDALKMLRAGQPIDQMLGYYVDRGEADKDVYMMDRLEKLHLLEELREQKRQAEEEIKQKLREAQNSNLNKIKDEQAAKQGQAAPTQAPIQTPIQNAAPPTE